MLRQMRGEEISQIQDDEQDFYGKNYYLHHVQEDYGLPDLETRARADLPERCLHWLRALLKFVPHPGARTLELGCGHGGFVAMQRWAGLDATGLELSPWLVRKAREWFHAPILEGRLENQELAPGSYDVVMMMDVLEHLPDPRQTLTRAVSLLRSPESFLLIQTPCYPVGLSYEDLCARDHPFLVQLKPLEHLYLFSEQAVQRLCAEIGVGQVRFEPAIFAHYDLFAVASAAPLGERAGPGRAEMLLSSPTPARAVLALLDMSEARDGLQSRLATVTAEYAATLEIAQRQGAEITGLHAASAEVWSRLNAAENARNLAAAQLADAQRQFDAVQSDNAARLAVIERQGAEVARLNGEVTRWLEEAGSLWPKLNAAENAHNLLAAQHEDLRGHFAQSERDREERLRIIEQQGAEISRLQGEVARWLQEAGDLWPQLNAAKNALNLKGAEYDDLMTHYLRRETEWNGAKAEARALESHLTQARQECGEMRAAAEAERLAWETERRSVEAERLAWETERRELQAILTDRERCLAEERSAIEVLRERQRRINKHWTTYVLKRLRLAPR